MAKTVSGPTHPTGRSSLTNATAGPSRTSDAAAGAGLGKGKGKGKAVKNTARKSTGGKAPKKSVRECLHQGGWCA